MATYTITTNREIFNVMATSHFAAKREAEKLVKTVAYLRGHIIKKVSWFGKTFS